MITHFVPVLVKPGSFWVLPACSQELESFVCKPKAFQVQLWFKSWMSDLYRGNLCLWNVKRLPKLKHWVFFGSNHGAWWFDRRQGSHSLPLGLGMKLNCEQMIRRGTKYLSLDIAVLAVILMCCDVVCLLWRAEWGEEGRWIPSPLGSWFLVYRLLVSRQSCSSLPLLLLKSPFPSDMLWKQTLKPPSSTQIKLLLCWHCCEKKLSNESFRENEQIWWGKTS